MFTSLTRSVNSLSELVSIWNLKEYESSSFNYHFSWQLMISVSVDCLLIISIRSLLRNNWIHFLHKWRTWLLTLWAFTWWARTAWALTLAVERPFPRLLDRLPPRLFERPIRLLDRLPPRPFRLLERLREREARPFPETIRTCFTIPRTFTDAFYGAPCVYYGNDFFIVFISLSINMSENTNKLRFAGAKSRGNPPLSQSLFAIFLVLVVRIAEICLKQIVPWHP